MLDKFLKSLFDPFFEIVAKGFIFSNLKANQITVIGFFLSIISFILILNNQVFIALIFFTLGRFFDCIDGAVARIEGITDFGGFLDIVLDFISYSLIVLGFTLINDKNTIAGAILLTSFFGTSSSFLAFAIFFHKTKKDNIDGKSFFQLGGILGGTETFIAIFFMFLFPFYFFYISLTFSFFCILATIERIFFAYKSFKN